MQLSQSKVQRQCYAALELFWGFFLSLPCFFFLSSYLQKPFSYTRKWKRVPSPDVALEFLYTLPFYIFSSLTAVCKPTAFHSHISIFHWPRFFVSPSLPASPAAPLSLSLSLSTTINAIDSRRHGQHFYRPHGKQSNHRCKSFGHDQEQRWWTGTLVRKCSTGTSPRGDLEPYIVATKFICHEPRRIHHLQPIPVQVRLQPCCSASGGEVLEQLSREPIRNQQSIFIVKHPLFHQSIILWP